MKKLITILLMSFVMTIPSSAGDLREKIIAKKKAVSASPTPIAFYKFENDWTDEQGTYDLTNSGGAMESSSPIIDSYSADFEYGDGSDHSYHDDETPWASASGGSIVAWGKFEAMGREDGLAGVYDPAGTARVLMLFKDLTSAKIFVGYNNGVSVAEVGHASTLVTGTEYFIVGTYNETTDTAWVYVYDNTCSVVGTNYEETDVLGVETWNKSETADIMVGASGTSGTPLNRADGLLDNVRLYDVVLTAAQVIALCEADQGL